MVLKDTPDPAPEEGKHLSLEDRDHPSAAPLPPGLGWIGPTAAQDFPLVIKAIEDKGSLPQHERVRIAEELIGAASVYRLRRETEGARLRCGEWIEGCEKVAASARHLLGCLGIEDPAALPGSVRAFPSLTRLLMPAIQMVVEERRGKDDPATLPAETRMMAMLQLLADVEAAARRTVEAAARPTVEEAGQQPADGQPPQHGGPRRTGQHGALQELLAAIVAIYTGVRERCPESGPAAAYSRGGPLARFVVACMRMVDSDRAVTDATIRGAFKSWRDQ
jgi:hypothetical protein